MSTSKARFIGALLMLLALVLISVRECLPSTRVGSVHDIVALVATIVPIIRPLSYSAIVSPKVAPNCKTGLASCEMPLLPTLLPT